MHPKFPDVRICTLLGRPELTEEETQMDSTLGFLTPVPFGMPEFMKSLREIDKDFYLVERQDEQLFVTVTDEFLDICPLHQKQTEKSFQLGGWTFIKGNYLAEE